MKTITGIVTLAQESRFQLIDDAGIAHFFVLSHGASAEPSQLGELQRRQARVRVRWQEAPNMIARVARRIELCEDVAAPLAAAPLAAAPLAAAPDVA